MNYYGSEKSNLLVIGKTAKPCGFPQNMKHFPVNYEGNKTAWMTACMLSKSFENVISQERVCSILFYIDTIPMRWDSCLRDPLVATVEVGIFTHKL